MSDTSIRNQGNSARECGPCTACCDGWLKISINGQAVEPGKKCQFSSGHDCTNYDNRPVDPCHKFICGWLAKQSPLPDWMRPDRSCVILLASYFHWRELPVDLAVPVAGGIGEKAFAWLKEFAFAKKRLLLYQVDEDWYAFGPSAFQTEMSELIGNGEQVWSLARVKSGHVRP